jgi:hypothetical protein
VIVPGDGGGTAVISSRRTVMRGSVASRAATSRENTSRSTASAAPAGTRATSAAAMTTESRRRISSLMRPTALSSLSPRNELLHTSSARSPVLWTGVGRTGRISWSVTCWPARAACHAASQPASPPPTM